MRVAVCVRRVLDPDANLKLAGDGTLDAEGVPYILDPVDAAALEAGVQLCEAHGGEVTAITAGGDAAEEALRTALAQGAASALRVDGPGPAGGAAAGAVLAAAMEEAGPFDVVLCGARSSEHGSGGTGAALAAGLGFPVVQNVVSIDEMSDGAIVVQRRRDGGYRELVRVALPAVLAVDALVAQPRFPTTQARLAARRAEIGTAQSRPPEGAGSGGATGDVGYRYPPPRLHGIAWPDVALDARDRLRFLVQGGQQRSGASARTVSGSADEVAAAVAAFLRERGLVQETQDT